MRICKNIITIIILMVLIAKSGQSLAQVHPQTGSATFDVPIFNWQDNKSRLNVLVALGYSGGNGIKVNELASNIGQGWSLTAGGSINRIQVGEPDDQKPYLTASPEQWSDVKKYPAGYLYNAKEKTAGVPTGINRYPLFKSQGEPYREHNVVAADRELDYFAYQFNGRGGMFILDGATNTGVCLGDNKLKITFSHSTTLVSIGIRTTISEFRITDENGLEYIFNKLSTAKLLKTEYCNKYLQIEKKQPPFKKWKVYHEAQFDHNNIINPNIVTGWYLTEIKDKLLYDPNYSVKFLYTNLNINTTASVDLSWNDKGMYGLVSHKSSVAVSPELVGIEMPDGHYVNFKYGDLRVDLAGARMLNAIDVKYGARFISSSQFKQSYFILNRYGLPKTDFQKKMARLCLMSVQQFTADLKDQNPAYTFDYFTGSDAEDDFVPGSYHFAKDIYGYYNGNYSKSIFGDNIDPRSQINDVDYKQIRGLCFMANNNSDVLASIKPGFAKNGLLKKIVLPTGGELNYEYEQNAGVINSVIKTIGGVHVSKVTSTDGGYNNNCGNPLIINYKYTLENSATPSMWGVEMPTNTITTVNRYDPGPKKIKIRKYTLTHYCENKYRFPGLLTREEAYDVPGLQKTMKVITEISGAIGMVMSVVNIIQASCAASGWGVWGAIIIEVIVAVFDFVSTCFFSQTRTTTTTMYYDSNIGGVNPLPAQYQRVEMIEQNGGNGRTVMEFTSDADYPVWEPANDAMSMKQRYASWAYGLPKKTVIYNAAGNRIKETENFYNYVRACNGCQSCRGIIPDTCSPIKRSLNLFSCKVFVKKAESQRIYDWENTSAYNNPNNSGYTNTSSSHILINIYNMYTGRTELDSTIEKVYSQSNTNDFQQTITTYWYNPNNYQPQVIYTKKDNGETQYKSIKYSSDYPFTPGIYADLEQANITGTPVSVQMAVEKDDGSFYKLNETVTEFARVANGNILPSKSLVKRLPQPAVQNGFNGLQPFNDYQPTNGTYNNTYYKTSQIFTYDNNSNLIGVKDEGNRTIHNIYGYADKQIIASVINADAMLDKACYTSFEVAGETGGWSVSGSGIITGAAITGKNTFALASGNNVSKTGLNTGKPYTLSLWATGTVSISSGATIKKSAPVKNGFTYYEYAVAQGTTSITISGSCNIDEVRLYPQTARMRTVAYDVLIGKTSDCDENNRLLYYTYDTRGRIRFTKDDDGNVVKMYEYNDKINAGRCPATYKNYKIRELFTRNNCGQGTAGTDYLYEIEAGKYSSNISQADADRQAQEELDALAQDFVNENATCITVFTSDGISRCFTKQNCPVGFEGGTGCYTVPNDKYTSTISREDAQQQAIDDMEANGQIYVNNDPAVSCTPVTDPEWEADEDAPRRCGNGSNGAIVGHIAIYMQDINPHSATYQSYAWIDGGPDPTCGTVTCTTSNCTGAYYKCINNQCEKAQTIPAGEQLVGNRYYCVYRYRWSDGSMSGNIISDIWSYTSGNCPD